MVKNSFEECYPWTNSDRWGGTTSPDTMRWVTKAWEEGLVESKTDLANLEDFNSTLKSLHEKLKTDTPQDAAGVQVTPGGAGAQRKPAQNRLPPDQDEDLRSSGDSVIEKCRTWVGSAGELRGKLGALCRCYLYMGGWTAKTTSIQEYADNQGKTCYKHLHRQQRKPYRRGTNMPKTPTKRWKTWKKNYEGSSGYTAKHGSLYYLQRRSRWVPRLTRHLKKIPLKHRLLEKTPLQEQSKN